MASGSFGAGLIQAELQFLVNYLVYNLKAEEIVKFPRFGLRIPNKLGLKYYRSSGFDHSIIESMKSKGIILQEKRSNSDIGLGAVLIFDSNGAAQEAKFPSLKKKTGQ